jgi:hypothetical protein
VVERFGRTAHRAELLAVLDLQQAGCRRINLDGSFVTDKKREGCTRRIRRLSWATPVCQDPPYGLFGHLLAPPSAP